MECVYCRKTVGLTDSDYELKEKEDGDIIVICKECVGDSDD